MNRFRARTACLQILGLLASGCQTLPEPAAIATIPSDVVDQRAQFRAVFCTVLEEHGAALPDYRPCAQALSRRGPSIPPEATRVEGLERRRPLVALLVPGIGYDCFRRWMHPEHGARDNLRRYGYDIEALDVDALSSSQRNAALIRDAILAMPEQSDAPRLVLIGYSKGAPDILEAIGRYPEIRSRIAAVVSVAGAIRGSTLADQSTDRAADLLVHFPGAECDIGDGQAVASLRPAVRQAFMAAFPPPPELKYYSIVTLPAEDNISRILQAGHRTLSKINPLNDGQLIYSDQIIPGSALLAFLDADHWAAVLPIHREHRLVATTLVTRNAFPREALLEAVMRHVDRDLADQPRRGVQRSGP